jgi:hypothetical protein
MLMMSTSPSSPSPLSSPACASNENGLAANADDWRVAIHDDRLLFEFLILVGAQAAWRPRIVLFAERLAPTIRVAKP